MIQLKKAFFCSFMILAACAPARTDSAKTADAAPRSISVDVERMISQMSVEEKVGQCFVIAGNANFRDEANPEFERLARGIVKYHAGGVIWYRSKVYETALLASKLQKLAKIPLIFSADLEAGMGMRFDNMAWAPWPMAIAATGEPKLAQELGYLTAVEARALGISQIYAPVADVNINPANPVINTRSYGEDPEDVSRFVNAFVKGCEQGGVLATVKHFPGHGDTAVDSHRSLPVLNVDRERLQKIELLPFREAFAAGCASVMIAHLAVPALDDTPAPLVKSTKKVYGGEEEREARGTLPATVSKKIVSDLLRKEMGFHGLVVTDAMDMGGLADHFDAKEGAIRAIEAGCDQILKSGDPQGAMEAVAEAVKSGRIPTATLDAAVRRILTEKAKLGLFDSKFKSVPPDDATNTVASFERLDILKNIAERSITLLRDDANLLPLKRGSKILHLAVTDETGVPAFAYSKLAFTIPLRGESGTEVVEYTINPKTSPEELQQILDAAKNINIVVMSLNVKARTGAGTIQAPASSVEIVKSLQKLQKPVVAVSLGSPYVARDFPHVPTFLLAYGSADVSQYAAAAALFGKFKITGRLPVTIPGVAKRGDGVVR